MNLLSVIRDQFRHMEWADALVWKSTVSSESTSKDDKIITWLLHLHMTQQAFLAVWQRQFANATQQEIMEWSQRGSKLRGAELLAWGKTYHQNVMRYLSGISETSLVEPAVLPWMNMVSAQFGKILVVPTLSETLLQVPMHSMHHRGQINARLRELDIDPPLTDFIAWIWLGKPAADWPEL
jgi:uncharacterized damage-inducible protein DinB